MRYRLSIPIDSASLASYPLQRRGSTCREGRRSWRSRHVCAERAPRGPRTDREFLYIAAMPAGSASRSRRRASAAWVGVGALVLLVLLLAVDGSRWTELAVTDSLHLVSGSRFVENCLTHNVWSSCGQYYGHGRLGVVA